MVISTVELYHLLEEVHAEYVEGEEEDENADVEDRGSLLTIQRNMHSSVFVPRYKISLIDDEDDFKDDKDKVM